MPSPIYVNVSTKFKATKISNYFSVSKTTTMVDKLSKDHVLKKRAFGKCFHSRYCDVKDVNTSNCLSHKSITKRKISSVENDNISSCINDSSIAFNLHLKEVKALPLTKRVKFLLPDTINDA